MLALAFSLTVVLIAALDRPLQGLVGVSQQALVDTRRGMDDQGPSPGGRR